MTERVVDVAARSVSWRSTVDLIVSQRCQRFTLSHTESYIKVHQSTAALQISTLHVYKIFSKQYTTSKKLSAVANGYSALGWDARERHSCTSDHRRRKGSVVGGHHGECGARGYNGGLRAEPPAGSRGRAPGQGRRSPTEAESILVIGCPTEPANLAPLVKFSK